MSFLKVLWNNLRQGPVTDAFPFGDTYTPERLRGRVEVDAERCVGCGTCENVCAAGAIHISRKADSSGFDITVWRNTCCLCAQCRHYCPTGAITLTPNWHNAHRNTEKYTWLTRASVTYDTCEGCGARMRFLPPSLIDRIYAGHPEVNVRRVSRLCPACRQLDTAVAEERACHIDHLQTLQAEGKACLLSDKTADSPTPPTPESVTASVTAPETSPAAEPQSAATETKNTESQINEAQINEAQKPDSKLSS